MMPQIVPKSKFNVGDEVNVRCDEAGCPPTYLAAVCEVRYGKDKKHYYSVTETGKDVTTDYTDEWLTPYVSTVPPQPILASEGKKICDDPDNCTYSDCPTAFCDKNKATTPPEKLKEVANRIKKGKFMTTEQLRELDAWINKP